MENAKKVSNELSAAGQVTPEQLQQAAQEGFKSVLNLRSPDEAGYLNDEEQRSQETGLQYASVPLNASEFNQELVEASIREIENLPKPVLVHCGAGARAAAIALIAIAIQEGLTNEQMIEKAKPLDLNLKQPHLKQFLRENFENDKEV